jgi:hypothetical protein
MRFQLLREAAVHDGYCSGSDCEYQRDELTVWLHDADFDATLLTSRAWRAVATEMGVHPAQFIQSGVSWFSYYMDSYDTSQSGYCERDDVPQDFTEPCNIAVCSVVRVHNVGLRFAWISACTNV